MCNVCGRAGYSCLVSLSINSFLYSGLLLTFNELRISAWVSYCYELFVRRVMNIKISLSGSIKTVLSTVSTPPITGPTILNFNQTIIIRSGNTTS